MKHWLRALIPLVLLLAALPSYAACGYCAINCNCVDQQGAGSRCRLDKDCCFEVVASCFSDGTEVQADLAAQYRIASVEVITANASRVQVAQKQKAEPVPVETASLKR